MGIFYDRLKSGSTAARPLLDWPKQKQISRKRARLVAKEHVPSQFLNPRDLTLNMNEFVVSQLHKNKKYSLESSSTHNTHHLDRQK